MSCIQNQKMKKTEDKYTSNGHLLITAEVAEKTFTEERAKITLQTDLYVRRPGQDLFIKFCESSVTKDEIKNALNNLKTENKSLTIEAEIRNGLWNSCDSSEMVQSRSGHYIIIHRLIDKQ